MSCFKGECLAHSRLKSIGRKIEKERNRGTKSRDRCQKGEKRSRGAMYVD